MIGEYLEDPPSTPRQHYLYDDGGQQAEYYVQDEPSLASIGPHHLKARRASHDRRRDGPWTFVSQGKLELNSRNRLIGKVSLPRDVEGTHIARYPLFSGTWSSRHSNGQWIVLETHISVG